jgi:hypothetical protein
MLEARLVTVALLVLIGVILTVGKTLYHTMVRVQGWIILLTLPFIAFLVQRLTVVTDWTELARGLVGQGDGWMFFPPAVAIGAFMGAFAYSGAGGNLNLAQSYYIKEKGMGMGKYGSKISSLFSGGSKAVRLEGALFAKTQNNFALFDRWWRLVLLEHGLVFWGLGLVTICLLAILSFATTQGGASANGLLFLYEQASVISQLIHPFVGTLFILSGAVMLFSTQLGVLESVSRIISENIILLNHHEGKKANPSLAFYITLWLLIGLGIAYILTGSREPRLMVTIGALMNAGAMMVAFPLIYLLNKKTLPKRIGPSQLRGVVFFIATVFFAYFLTLSVTTALKGGL